MNKLYLIATGALLSGIITVQAQDGSRNNGLY